MLLLREGRLMPVGVGGLVVALSWWWGVVFDLWIVVASIMPARVSSLGGAGVG